MKVSDKSKKTQKLWRENNREKINAYFKKRCDKLRAEINERKASLAAGLTFSIKLENPKVWEKRYKEAFEEA